MSLRLADRWLWDFWIAVDGDDPRTARFHMLVCARAAGGPPDGRGVIGHAWSEDLATWTARRSRRPASCASSRRPWRWHDDDGAFLGELGDPMAIEAGADGSLAVVGSDARRV